MEPEYVAENDRERQRLEAVVAALAAGDLGAALDKGLTVAEVLVHMAFWDDYCCALFDQWERTGFSAVRSNFDVVNAALGPLARAIPVASAGELAVTAARRVDRRVEDLPPELIAAIELNGYDSLLRRAEHRRTHLGQIERATGAAAH